MDIKRLTEACKWLQRNDKNSDYIDMLAECYQGEIAIESIYEVCRRSFTEIRDLQLSPDDTKDKERMNEWLEYIK